jgi:hypothetical protein
MEISYSRVGDYLLPNLKLKDPPPELVEPLGRYGRLRRTFLCENRPIQYSILVLTEQLFPHLRQVDMAARERLDTIMSDILVFQPPPDKASDGLAWAAHMETVKRTAERMMMDEIVYA